MTTDSILRTYSVMTTTSLVPFPTDISLLAGETDGLAIDFTSSTWFDTQVYDQDWNQVRTSGVDVYSSPHSFYTNSGTSAKVVKTSSTGLGWSPHNLRLQSQSGTGWTTGDVSGVKTANATTAPDGTNTGNSWTADSGSDQHYIFSPNTTSLVASTEYTLSVYLKYLNHQFLSLYTAAAVNQWFEITIDIVNGTITQITDGTSATSTANSITNVGNGWYRVSVTGTITGTSINHQMGINSTGTPTLDTNGDETITAPGDGFYWWGAQLNRGAPTAYIATTTAAVIGLPISYGEGLWGEPAATNLILQSQDISTTWTNGNSSESVNSTTAPDGSTTADTLIENSSNAQHQIFQAITKAASSLTYTFSIYAKAKERTRIGLEVDNTGTAGAFTGAFNLVGGAIAGNVSTFGGAGFTAISQSIAAIGNDWYRCTLTLTTDTATTVTPIVLLDNGSGVAALNTTYTGDGASGVYLWGAQLELGTVATSYIPTTTASVTRAKDQVGVNTSSFPLSATTNTVYTDTNAFDAALNSAQIYIIGTDAIGFQQWLTTAFRASVDNTTNQVNITTGAYTQRTRTQATFALQANNFALSIDGATIVPDVSGTMPSGLTTLSLGHDAGSAQTNGYIRRFILTNRRVSDADLLTWRYNV